METTELNTPIHKIPIFNYKSKYSIFRLPRVLLGKSKVKRTERGLGYAGEHEHSKEWDVIRFYTGHYFKVLLAKYNNGTLRNPEEFWQKYILPYQKKSSLSPSVSRSSLKEGDVVLLIYGGIAIITKSPDRKDHKTGEVKEGKLRFSSSYNHKYLHHTGFGQPMPHLVLFNIYEKNDGSPIFSEK
jgi:hypothetical protein